MEQQLEPHQQKTDEKKASRKLGYSDTLTTGQGYNFKEKNNKIMISELHPGIEDQWIHLLSHYTLQQEPNHAQEKPSHHMTLHCYTAVHYTQNYSIRTPGTRQHNLCHSFTQWSVLYLIQVHFHELILIFRYICFPTSIKLNSI